MLRIALLNLPNPWPVMRRFMCSTRAANYLFPPQELMYLASTAKERHSVKLIDAIAEKKDFTKTMQVIKGFKPDLIVSLIGFECFENDMKTLHKVKEKLQPHTKTLCFGYYPTLFPKQVMGNTNTDFLIRGEPELVFSKLIERLSIGKPLNKIAGLCFRESNEIVSGNVAPRIQNLDGLPLPSHELLKQGLYSEPFLGKPYTAIQTSRGCPFQCTYCVSTYGKQLVFRSSENILKEIEFIESLGIKNFRFIDDTFTVNRQRVMQLCNAITEKSINVQWTCLSRVDTLDRGLLEKMKEAGCKRIFLGIESGSQKVLNWLKKGYRASELSAKIKAVSEAGIESLGFFIVGAPVEKESDFQQSIELAKNSKLDYVVVSRLLAYPGTELFTKMHSQIRFSLFPYKNEFKSKELERKWLELEKRFYRAFYFRPGYMLQRLSKAIKNPKEFAFNTAKLMTYLAKGPTKERQDLF